MSRPAKICNLPRLHTTLLTSFSSVLSTPNSLKNPKARTRTSVSCSLLSSQPATISTFSDSSSWSLAEGYKKLHDPKSPIYDYLRGLGIDTMELQELDIPTAVSVMKERVEFLQNVGLTIDDINEYPLVLACSVKRNMVPVLDYLEKLGVRKTALPEMLRRYPQILHSSVVIDLQPVIKFLGGLDIKENNIPRVIEMYPELLGFKLEGTMSTSVAYLVSIGVNRRGIGPMLTQYPQILAMRVGRVIKPFVEYVESIGVKKEVLARVLEKKPYVLGFHLEKQVKVNVESLLTFGVRKQALRSIIEDYAEVLGLDMRGKLEAQREFLELVLGVGVEEFARILERMPQVVALSGDPVMKRIGVLRSWGFSREDMRKMVVVCPQLLALNLDVMRLSFEYFRDEIRGTVQELVEFPAYFTYSLETRIKPRFRKLSRKGIKCSLAWFLICNDQKFEQRLQAEYIGIEEMEPSLNRDEPEVLEVDESSEEQDESEESEDYEDNEEEEDGLDALLI